MSATKELFYNMTEVESMREYLDDDLDQRDDANIAFHIWAVAQHEAHVLESFKLQAPAMPELRDWFYKVLCADDQLLDIYNEERIDTATRLFNYYRQAYAKVGA